MNDLMKKVITEKIEWLREHGVLCYIGDLDSATPAEIDKLCEAIEDMTAQVIEREGEGKPWEDERGCYSGTCGCCNDDDDKGEVDKTNDLMAAFMELLDAYLED